jgi:mono/diheme cytochrome c family protein
MRKMLKLIRTNPFVTLICTSIITWPLYAFAHGWKAPSEAAEIYNPVEYSEPSIAQGGKLYDARCAGCHGTEGKGDGRFAKNLDPKPANLVERLKDHSEGDFFWKISYGRGPMPGFKNQLSEKKIWDVINYIKSFSNN